MRKSECIRCSSCVNACSEGAINLNIKGRIDRQKCNLCGKCIEACPGTGLRIIGKYYSISELLEILLRDLSFYKHSGGGVTLSGGEITLYPDYLNELGRELKKSQIHIAIETSGYFEYDTFKRKIMPYVDLILFDLKIADLDAHKKYTGKSNQKIFENLKKLIKEGAVEIQPRIPLVPGITTSKVNLKAIIAILFNAGAGNVSLIPYNPLGFEMAEKIGKPLPALSKSFMKPEKEEEIYIIMNSIIDELNVGSITKSKR